MQTGYEPLHAGTRFRIVYPDGRVVLMTAKEFLAHRARYNAAFPWTSTPSPDAGPRRLRNPGGRPVQRPVAPGPLRRPGP